MSNKAPVNDNHSNETVIFISTKTMKWSKCFYSELLNDMNKLTKELQELTLMLNKLLELKTKLMDLTIILTDNDDMLTELNAKLCHNTVHGIDQNSHWADRKKLLYKESQEYW